MNINKIPYLVIVGLIVGIIFITSLINNKNKEINQLVNNIETIDNGWKFTINSLDSTIVSQEQVILNKNNKIAKLADTIKGLKNQKQRIKIVTKTVIKHDTIKIPEKEIVIIQDTSYLKLPYTFFKNNKWYGYNFTINKEQVLLNSLYFNTDTEVIWGVEDFGFIKNIFKENKPIVSIIQKNPYQKNKEIKNYTFKDYKKDKIKIGLQTGYGITPKGLQPYIGAGISLNIK